MRTSVLALLLLILTAAVTTFVDARRSSSRSYSSYRSYRYSSYRYSSYRYSYRSPLYTRRLSSNLMGALYFSYVSRYPRHFSYRRSAVGSSGGSCTNRLALSNGSYVGSFSCPFLGDEPSSWTKCCGYENEQFCCDPAYDDSWALASQGLSFVAIFFIVGGCLTGLAIVGVLIFLCVRKGLLNTRRPGPVTAPTAATAVVTSPPVSVAPVQAISKWVPMAPGPGQPPVVDSNPPPYPTSNAGQPPVVGSNPPSYPTSNAGQPPFVGMENQGFEPPPYPLYPPSYQGPYANANAPDYG
uniref:CX domain-containing protein n=1 Tax=Macrostomum lignano TaxID=282301 RepID=A0A1I8INH6_9PLAT